MCCCRCFCFFWIYTHTYTTTLTSAEHLCALIGLHNLRHIDEDVASVLHQVLFFLTEVTLTSAVYLLNGIERVVVVVRTEVDEGIVEEWLVVARTCMTFVFKCRTFATCCVEVFSIMWIFIVIHTVCATENLLHAPLYIFYICRGIEHIGIIHLAANCLITQTAVEVCSIANLTAKVITAIYEVTNVWETVGTDIRLSMSEDISVTSSSEGVEDTSVAQLDDTVTSSNAQEAATIHELTFGDVFRHAFLSGYTRNSTVQVDVGAVS